jgi:aldehyde dehydrogenase (NAD+)
LLGNQVVLKPSELTGNTSAIISKIIKKRFIQIVEVVQGGVDVSNLLAQRWDYIFFTGSVAVGKIVAQAAAEPAPVTLELGGKNPCIIDETANLKLAAKKELFGKICKCRTNLHCSRLYLDSKDMKNKFIDYLKVMQHMATNQKNP